MQLRSGVGLCIIYFKRYDTYHDTHEAIFDMYQRYILSSFFTKKNLIYPQSFHRKLEILMTKIS